MTYTLHPDPSKIKILLLIVVMFCASCKDRKDRADSPLPVVDERLVIKSFDPSTRLTRMDKYSWYFSMYNKDSFSFGTGVTPERPINYQEAKMIADSLVNDYIRSNFKIPL